MSNITLIIVVVVAVVVVVAIVVVGYQMARQRRTRQLREQYGPEYDRAVDLADSQHEAEAELRGRSKRHEQLGVRTSGGLGQTYRANSWTTQAPRCATPTYSSWR